MTITIRLTVLDADHWPPIAERIARLSADLKRYRLALVRAEDEHGNAIEVQAVEDDTAALSGGASTIRTDVPIGGYLIPSNLQQQEIVP